MVVDILYFDKLIQSKTLQTRTDVAQNTLYKLGYLRMLRVSFCE